MKRDPRDDRASKLDALLAQGRLGGPARERILAEALDAAQPPRRRWQRTLVWLGPLTAFAALLLVVWVRPPSGFRARGGADGAPVLEVGCTKGELTACPAGSTLVFRAGAVMEPGFLVAYADPMGAMGSGQRVWYFAGPTAPAVAPTAAPLALREGVRLGPEHAPGAYRVHLLLARRALTRDETKAPPPGLVIGETAVEMRVMR